MEMNDSNDVAILIPARYASTRFPGKPLADLCGKSVIRRVCEAACEACPNVAVATDDDRIAAEVESCGFRAVMTSPAHKTGTDRIIEALDKMGNDPRIVINVQGDEPFVSPLQIRSLIGILEEPDAEIATLARKFDPSEGFEALFDPNKVKVVFDDGGKALYFSRSIIPYVRGAGWKEWLSETQYYIHLGMYGYKTSVLRKIAAMPQSSLEKAESLEQLRWLQAGYRIGVAVTERQTIGIDTPADLEAAKAFLRQQDS